MIKLIKIMYDIETEELDMYDVHYTFKEGEKSKRFPVSVIGTDLKNPKGIVLFFKYDNFDYRFEEAENYFYSLDVDFENIDYMELQYYRLEIFK